jgi:hypothetical protein
MDSPISQVAKTRNFAVIVLSVGSQVGSLADKLTRIQPANSAANLSYSIESADGDLSVFPLVVQFEPTRQDSGARSRDLWRQE